jgi:hypothetical protein
VGSEGRTTAFTVDNTAHNQRPEVVVSTPAGAKTGVVKIEYIIKDAESDLQDVTVLYSTESMGDNWESATVAAVGDPVTDLESSPSGVGHTFFWDSRADEVGGDGAETVKMRVIAEDFNESEPADSGEFDVDNAKTPVPPTVTITSGPSGTVTTRMVTFEWDGDDTDGNVTGYYWSMDNPRPDEWTGATEIELGPLANGEHTFYVAAEDNDKLLSEVASRTFTVQAVNLKPAIEILTGPEGTVSTAVVTFTYLGHDNDGTIENYYIGMDSSDVLIMTSHTTYESGVLDEGPHTFYVQCEDNDGERSELASQSFEVDTEQPNVAPEVTITGGPAGNTVNTRPTFTYEGTDNDGVISGYYVSIDDATPEELTNTTSYRPASALSTGEHVFYVQAIDDDSAVSEIASREFRVVTPGTGPFNWVRKYPANQPSPRDSSAFAFDPVRNVAVLFGGFSGGSSRYNDTWEWNGTNWTEKFPSTSPAARNAPAITYHASSGKMIMFGGWGGGPRNDTWEWDGSNWTRKNPSTIPPVREGSAMVYDPLRDVTMMFGGRDSDDLNDTWEWDGTNWTEKSPSNQPSPRVHPKMVFDSARGVIVLFGGAVGSSVDFNDTWEWNGSDWTQKFPTTSPPTRHGHGMAYNSSMGVSVLFGGRRPLLSDTWKWDGTDWTQLSPADKPSARFLQAMTYDTTREKIVLFGGYATGTTYVNDTWEGFGNEKYDIQEDFDDGTLDSRFGTVSSGTCAFFENTATGFYQIDLGGSSSDAGIVYLKDPLDVTKPMTIKHRERILSSGGAHGWAMLDINQSSAHPECVSFGTLQPDQRIGVGMRSYNLLQIGYVKPDGNGMHWDPVNEEWTASSVGLTTPSDEFYTTEFHSDGTEWYVIVRDKNGSLLMQTTPVLWSAVKNDGDDYWFYWGDECTTYFYGDGESDYIYMNYTPKETGTISINENFGDGTLDSRFSTSENGTCSWSFPTGIMRMNCGTDKADAGIVRLNEAIDMTKECTIKTRARMYNIGDGGAYPWWPHSSFLMITQRDACPEVAPDSVVCASQRIYVGQCSKPSHAWDEHIDICYNNASGTLRGWDCVKQVWVNAGTETPYKGVLGDYYTVEFHSDGTEWYIVIKDSSGTAVDTTTPVSWSNLKDSGDSYWWYAGEHFTDYYHSDMDVDSIYMNYTPE